MVKNGNAEVIFKQDTKLMTESEFPAKSSADEVLKFLRTERATGQFVIHLASGGVQRMVLLQREKVEIE